MRLTRLRARGWRNLWPLDLVFDPAIRLNVLFGDNAQGKTNVLEAVYYLAAFRSFRTSQAADLVQVGAEEARVLVEVETSAVVRAIEARLSKGGDRSSRSLVGRTVLVDGKPARGLRAAFGALSVVLFVPEDLLLVRAPPAVRRRFLDLAVAGVNRTYFDEASAFQKVLSSRNALLRSSRGATFALLLDTYDEQLARFGARVVMRRRELVRGLGPRVSALFRALHSDLAVELEYRSAESISAAEAELDVAAALVRGLRERRSADGRRGHTTFGPQTDDLEVRLGGRPAREHASQAQLRSIVLALKLAELVNLEAAVGEMPVLLLDDVPSELDATRRGYLFEALGGLECQTIVTVADRSVVPPGAGRGDFSVEGGRVRPVGLAGSP